MKTNNRMLTKPKKSASYKEHCRKLNLAKKLERFLKQGLNRNISEVAPGILLGKSPGGGGDSAYETGGNARRKF